jgi:hypothetical protein
MPATRLTAALKYAVLAGVGAGAFVVGARSGTGEIAHGAMVPVAIASAAPSQAMPLTQADVALLVQRMDALERVLHETTVEVRELGKGLERVKGKLETEAIP